MRSTDRVRGRICNSFRRRETSRHVPLSDIGERTKPIDLDFVNPVGMVKGFGLTGGDRISEIRAILLNGSEVYQASNSKSGGLYYRRRFLSVRSLILDVYSSSVIAA